MPNITEDFLPGHKYLLSAYIFQMLSRIQGFSGEHLQHLHGGHDGKASAFISRQQNKKQWNICKAGGGENLCIR